MATDHIATLEEMLVPGQAGWMLPQEQEAIRAAIALMRGQSEEWEKVGVLDGYGRITGDPKIRMIERRLEPGTLLYRFIPAMRQEAGSRE